MIPGLERHIEGDGLARERITIPVRQLKIVVATRKARAIVNTGPGGLTNSIGSFPPPALQVISVENLNFANSGVSVRQIFRFVSGTVPAIAQHPFKVGGRVVQTSRGRRNDLERKS